LVKKRLKTKLKMFGKNPTTSDCKDTMHCSNILIDKKKIDNIKGKKLITVI